MSTSDELEALISRRWRHLVTYGYMLTGDIHLAEDLTQQAIVRCLKRWPSIDAKGAESYLRRVIARLAWQASQRTREVSYPEVPDLPGRVSTDSEALRALVESLPRDQRVVIVLRYWYGMSEKEIAAAVGCRPGTVKSRAARAIKYLRQTWQEPDS